jgi:addiction module RelB/DinJ family antitoxin
MTAKTFVRARIDETLKKEAAIVLASMGLTVSDVVRIALTKIAKEKKLPFEMRVPKKLTIGDWMSTALVFDTLQYAKRLKQAGFTEEQAEVQAEALKELIDDQLITKQDIKILEYKLTIKLGGIIVTCTVVLGSFLALIKFLA